MIKTGLDNFIFGIDKYKNRNIALIVNHTSVSSDLHYSWDYFRQAGLKVKCIFSPEHGLFGTEQDQVPVVEQPTVDAEVVSLYGNDFESLLPDRSLLDGIDLVIFDIQDVGARYYTYLNTMILFMKSISGMDVEFLVLDRPNPIGGLVSQGPILCEGYESFCGILPTTVQHGMTAAELALMAQKYFDLRIDLNYIKMSGWQREFFYQDTGLPWVPPSPNMPSLTTAIVYPGMCLFEGLNISEGRGTTTPFELWGAPFVNPTDLCSHLNSLNLNGIYFRPQYYKPKFNKYSGQNIGGVFIHVTELKEYKSFEYSIAIVKSLFDFYEELEFLHGVYEFNKKYPAFDLLAGSSKIREMIQRGVSFEEICSSWEQEEREFCEVRREYLLY